MKKLLVFLMVGLGMLSCDSNKKGHKAGDKIAGEKVAGWYYYHSMNQAYDSIPKLLSNDYFDQSSKLALQEKVKKRNNELGAITSFTLLDWEASKVKEDNKRNTNYVFVYDVNYERGKGEETIHLERKDHKTLITKVDFVKK